MYKIKTFRFIVVVQILILCSVNHLWAQGSWPMVIKNTRFPDYPFTLPQSLLIRTSPDSTSPIRTSFLYMSGYDGKLVASAVVPGVGIGGTVVSPPLGYPSGQTTSYWYRVYIPGIGLTAPTEGYCAAGTTFTNPECGAPYIEVVFSSVFIRTGPSTSSLNVTIGGLPAKIFLGQKYAVADQLDVGGIRWYQIHLPKGTNTHPEDCSQNTGWVAGSSGSTTLVTLGTTGTNALPAPSALNTTSVTHDIAALNWSMNFYPAKTLFSINTCSGSSVGLSYDPTTSCFSYTPTNCTISSLPNCTNCVYARASYVSEMAVCVSSNSAPHSVTLQSPSAVTVTGVTPFCESTTLSASGGSGGTIYYQGLASGGTSTTAAMTSQTVYSTGAYFFRSRSSAGCWGPEGSFFVSTNRPSPPVVSGGGTHCNTATITASGGSDGTIYYQGSVMGGTSISDPSTSKTITSSGTYYFRKRSSTGCWGDPTGISVTINTAPGSITGATNVCAGSSISLSNTTPSGTWSSSNTLVASVGLTNGVVNGISNGVVTITYRTDCGFSTYNITVNPLPLPISGIGSVCEGMTTTLTTVSGGGTWSSGNISRATVVSGTGVVTGVSAGTVLISYILPTGCYTTKELTINPFPSTIGGATEVCAESTITLSNTVGGGTWGSSNTSVATVGLLTGVVAGLATGTSVITYTVGASCYETKIITVNPIPSAISGISNVCVGMTTNLTNITSGGTWSSGNISRATVVSGTGVVTGVSAGTVLISYILPTGCYTTKVLTINPFPSTIAGATEVCAESTITLSNTVGGGTWSSSNTSVATVGLLTGVVTGVATGTSVITYTVGASCYETKTITVNPIPLPITGSNSVCVGLTTTLSNATLGGTWSSSNSSVASIGSVTGIVTGVSAGSVLLSYALSTGCFVTKTITVNPIPSIIGGPSEVCAGSTIMLSNAIASGTWSSSNSVIATVGLTSGLLSSVAVGTTIITYTVDGGCLETKIITVNPVPSPITGSNSICLGFATTLSSVTGGGTWSSSNTSIATIESGTGVVNGISAGTVIVSYVLTTGCFVAKEITVNPLPSIISGPTVLCVGANINLSNTIGGGTWSSSIPSLATVGLSTGVVNGLAAGTVIITYTIAASCYETKIITVNPLPSSITGSHLVCEGSSTALSSTTSGGTWSSSNNSVATVGVGNGIVTGVSNGTATITYRLNTGCQTTYALTVSKFPEAGTITGPSTVCVGASINLTTSIIGGSWYLSNGNITITPSGMITGISSGVTSISYVVANICGATFTSAVVTINPLPDAGVILGDSSVCVGSTLPLTGSVVGGIWGMNNSFATVSGGVVTGLVPGKDTCTYTVSNICGTDIARKTILIDTMPVVGALIGPADVCVGSDILVVDSTNSGIWRIVIGNAINLGNVIKASTTGSDTIYYTITNACGSDSTSHAVTIHPSLDAGTINGIQEICIGDSDTLWGYTEGGIWSNVNGNIFVSNGIITGIKAGVDTIIYTVSNLGCSDVANLAVTVNQLPFAGTITGPDKICEGDTVSFSSTVLGGHWSSINSLISILYDSIAYGMFGGIDTLFYSVENMCGIDTTIKVVTIKGLPDAGLINGPSTLCVGGTILLKDTVLGGVWSSSNSLVSVTGGKVTGIDVGFSVVRYVVVNECGVDTAKHLVQVYGQPAPPIIERTLNDIYVTPIYGSYQWSVNGSEIPDAVMYTHKVIMPGIYEIKISDMYGCFNYSTIKIDTIFCDSSSLQVYPNPSKGIINFDWCKPLNARLHCADGRFVKFEKGVNKIDVSDLSNGIYLLSLFNEELKLIKVIKVTKMN